MTKPMDNTLKYGLLALVAAVVIIGGAYYLHTSNASQTTGAAENTARTYALTVQNRQVVSGDTVLTAQEGDTVSITITADESDELHLHGYDKSVDFEAGVPATLTFVADKTGRFPFEMEGSKTDLGELQVQP